MPIISNSTPENKIPPLKGSFPLDHDGDCKPLLTQYLKCLSQHRGQSLPCRPVTRKYLECRMNNELMEKEPLTSIGFAPEEMDADFMHK